MTQKYPQSLHTPKHIHFSENPKNIEFQNFEPPKNDPSLRTYMYENIRVPPFPLGVSAPQPWVPYMAVSLFKVS